MTDNDIVAIASILLGSCMLCIGARKARNVNAIVQDAELITRDHCFAIPIDPRLFRACKKVIGDVSRRIRKHSEGELCWGK